jgi:amphi-Trp domain-containing protein
MDRVVVSLRGEKKDLEDTLALFRALQGQLAEDPLLPTSGVDEIQLTLPDLLTMELRLHEREADGRKRPLELEMEWIDGDAAARPADLP